MDQRAANTDLQTSQAEAGGWQSSGDQNLQCSVRCRYRYLRPETVSDHCETTAYPHHDRSRDVALEQMIATGAMHPDQEIAARRMLVSLALQDNQRTLARQRLEHIASANQASSRELANLAILLREQSTGEPIQTMSRAIATAQSEGGIVPQGWYDFVKAPDS